MLVNLQPFFYGRSFTDIAHEKDIYRTAKRCIGLMGFREILLTWIKIFPLVDWRLQISDS
jgi:hypothetical protein